MSSLPPSRTRKPRIFMGCAEIAGYYTKLKEGFDRLGVESVAVDLYSNKHRYVDAYSPHGLVRIAKWIGTVRTRTPRREPTFLLWTLFRQLIQIVLLLWAILTFDVFIFGFKYTFLLTRWDLPLLRWLGKTIICVFHGSDSHPPYLEKFDYLKPIPERKARARWIIRQTLRQKKSIRWINRYASYCIDFPLWAHFHERPFISLGFIGLPQSLKVPKVQAERELDGKVRILHCPSNPAVKGSHLIRAMVRSLKEEGLPIDYQEVTGRPNAEVLRAIQTCDFVADELWTETAMGQLGAEAAIFGKPTLVGGYGGEEHKRVYKPETLPPTYYSSPENFQNAMRELILNRALREDLGNRARAFVLSEWSATTIAAKYLRIIDGDIPADWWFDPWKIRYVQGACMSEEQIRDLLASVVEEGGPEALQVDDKPEVKARLLEFMREKSSVPAEMPTP